MSEDINVNALAEAINDKMDRDAGNIVSPMLPVFLVDVQYPTSENDYTWYRLYSDGWVEQGGCVGTTSGTNSVTFSIAMIDNSYSIFTTGQSSGSSKPSNTNTPNKNTVYNYTRIIYNKTTTGFDVGGESEMNQNGFSWQVSGMSALPAVNPIGLLENTMKKVVDGEGVVDTTKLNSAETSIASFLNI